VEIKGSSPSGVLIPVVPLVNIEKVSVLKSKGQIFAPELDLDVNNNYKVNQIGKTDSIIETETTQDVFTRGKTRGKVKQSNTQKIEPIQTTIQKPQIQIDQIQTPKLKPNFNFVSRFTAPPIPFLATFRFGEAKKSGINLGGFNVLARKGGKFVKINTGGALSYSEAKNFGAFNVDRDLSATFKLVDAKESAKSSFNKKGNFGNFYTKDEGGDELFIEKSFARLNTQSEVRQIRGKKTSTKLKRSIFNV